MREFGQHFEKEIKSKLDVELVGMASVETSKELKDRAASLLPNVKSVVVLGKEIYKEVVSLLEASKKGREVERGELLRTHTEYLNGRLNRAVHELAILLKRDGYRSLPLPAGGLTDQRFLTSFFSHKHATQLAGLGMLGRHSLLIAPEFGPRVRLACLLTEASMEDSKTTYKDYCISCGAACIRECPAQALQVPGQGEAYSINKFACYTYRQAGLICGVCMRVCDEVMG